MLLHFTSCAHRASRHRDALPSGGHRVGRGQAGCLIAIALVMLVSCGGERPLDTADLALQNVGLASPEQQDTEQGTFEFLGFVTAANGADATDRISAVGATDLPDQITVSNLDTCQVYLFDLRRRRKVGARGRCGEGPGEFRYVGDAVQQHDSLYVSDPDRQQMIVFGPDGTEARRVAFRALLPGGISRVTWLRQLAPARYVVIRTPNPIDAPKHAGDLDWRAPLLRIDAEGPAATVAAAPVTIPLAAERMTRGTNSMRGYEACLQPGSGPGTGHVVIAQPFTMETVVLDDQLHPVSRSLTRTGWSMAQRDTGRAGRAGRLEFGIARIYVACGTDRYAVAARAFAGRNSSGGDTHGRVEVRRYDGTLMAARNWTAADLSQEIGSPRVVLGDTLVTVRTDITGFQRVGLWRIH